jgi:hypothetical protein
MKKGKRTEEERNRSGSEAKRWLYRQEGYGEKCGMCCR